MLCFSAWRTLALFGAVGVGFYPGEPALAQESTVATSQRVLVAPDGSGDFKTVQEAVNAAPTDKNKRFIITLKPGIYHEKLVIARDKGPLTLKGDDAATTILTFDDYAGKLDAEGKPLGTGSSYSAMISSDDFIAENLTFENTHEIGGGTGNQALALSFSGDRGVFRKCRFLGKQDTVYIANKRQYFEDCFLAGQVDFIFGGATAWFERCELHCVAPGISITAASTPETEAFGYVFSNCKITTPEGATWKTHLGRPWRPFAAVSYLNTEMADVIHPFGWHNWGKTENEKTARYSEFGSTGPGANAATRAPWSKQLSDAEAQAITLEKVMGNWNPKDSLATLTGPVAATKKSSP